MTLATDLTGQLEAFIDRYTQTVGHRPTALEVGRPEWEAMGCPDIIRGVRIRPSPLPVEALSTEEQTRQSQY